MKQDELLNYKPNQERHHLMEKDINQSVPKTPTGGGSKLSTIFLIVLGLHIIVIIGISAFHLLRNHPADELASDFDNSNSAPSFVEQSANLGEPIIETQPGQKPLTPPVDLGADQNAVPQASQVAQTSMPASNDPIWTLPPDPEVRKDVLDADPGVVRETSKPSWTYTVVKGDSLSKIARTTGASVKDIRSLNNLASDLIRIGDQLQIPGSQSVAQNDQTVVAKSESTPASHVASADSSYTIYTVAKGDTITRIARIFRTTPKNLAQINGLKDPNKIKIGMELKVPYQSQTADHVATPQEKPFRTPVNNTDLAMLRDGEI